MTALLIAWLLVSIAAGDALAAEPHEPAPPTSTASPPPPVRAAIPVAEVATRASEVATLIRSMTAPLATGVETAAIRSRLTVLQGRIDRELVDAARVLGQQPTLDVLQAQQQLWQRRQLEASAWLNALTQRATLLQETLNRFAVLRTTWSQTREAARAASAPAPILSQIDGVLETIEVARAPLEARRNIVLDLQSAVAQQVARSGGMLDEFTEAQQRAMGGILGRDSPPIWRADSWRQARAEFSTRVASLAADHWAAVVGYLRDLSEGLLRRLAFLAVVTIAFLAARRTVRRWAATPEGASAAMRVFERPYSATAAI